MRPLACYSPDWKAKVHEMRMRIEKERTPPGKDALAFKTGSGGLIDAEFIAQAVCLERGWQEANTLRVLQRAGAEGALEPAEASRRGSGARTRPPGRARRRRARDEFARPWRHLLG